MRYYLIFFLLLIGLDACSLKKKTSEKTNVSIKEKIDQEIESVKKEIRNPGTNISIWDKIINQGESFIPIERTIKGFDNSELTLTVNDKGEINVTFIKPSDTLLIENKKTKIKSDSKINSNTSSKEEIKNDSSFKTILISIIIIILSVLVILYKIKTS